MAKMGYHWRHLYASPEAGYLETIGITLCLFTLTILFIKSIYDLYIFSSIHSSSTFIKWIQSKISTNKNNDSIELKLDSLSKIDCKTKALYTLSLIFSEIQTSLWLITACMITYYDIRIPCGTRSVLTSLSFAIQRIFLYLFFIYRIYISFHDTIFAVTIKFAIILSVFYAILVCFGAGWYMYATITYGTLDNYNDDGTGTGTMKCQHRFINTGVAPALAVDIISNFLLGWFFVFKIKQVLFSIHFKFCVYVS